MSVKGQSDRVPVKLARVRQQHAAETMSISGAYGVISRGTASPVLVTDEHWRIVTLNPEAERLLGCSSNDAKGRPCNTLLYRRDRFGNNLHHEQCDVGSMVRRGETVHTFEFDVVNASGDMIHTACSVIVFHDGPECRIVHILTPIPRAAEDTAVQSKTAGSDVQASSRAAIVAQRYALTAREHEVLQLLAQGSDCHRIAKTLFISLSTARNHVHNFLRKLDVHSQVEAVALAHRQGLI